MHALRAHGRCRSAQARLPAVGRLPAALSTGPGRRQRPPSREGRRPRRHGGTQRDERDAWWVRTSAAVTAASATTAASAAAGSVWAGADGEPAASLGALLVQPSPSRPASWPNTGTEAPS